jgi:acetoin utilization protein AcuB
LVGVVSETDLLDYERPDEQINVSKLHLLKPSISQNEHAYDLVRLMSSLNLTLIPVMDEKDMYKGCITLKGVVQHLSTMISAQNPGGVIVLEMNQHDYSLTQIASIIESNETKILSLHVTTHPESTKLDVTIKVNREDLSRILQTFNRYNYAVKATFQHGDYNKGLDDRLNEFLHFLNI